MIFIISGPSEQFWAPWPYWVSWALLGHSGHSLGHLGPSVFAYLRRVIACIRPNTETAVTASEWSFEEKSSSSSSGLIKIEWKSAPRCTSPPLVDKEEKAIEIFSSSQLAKLSSSQLAKFLVSEMRFLTGL